MIDATLNLRGMTESEYWKILDTIDTIMDDDGGNYEIEWEYERDD